jgi:hypothetical protein
MLKKIVISLSAVAFILGAGTSFAASLNSTHLMNGQTTKAEVISLYGEPKDKSNDKFIYQEGSVRLDVAFKNDVVSSSHQNNDNN